MKRANGFTIVEVILVVIVLGLIGVVGYNAIQRISNDQPTTSQVTPAVAVPEAPAISQMSDLDSAVSTLDQINLDDNANELTNLENDLATF